MIGLIALVIWRRARPGAGWACLVILSPLRFGLIVSVTTAALFNVAMVRGDDRALCAAAGVGSVAGRAVDGGALVYGALNGVALAGLFAELTVINRVLPVRSVLRHNCRQAYYWWPWSCRCGDLCADDFGAISRSARRSGGARPSAARRAGWLPLVIPLLEGMERSLQLAEAMMARRFAGGSAPRRWPQLLAVLGGFVLIVAGCCNWCGSRRRGQRCCCWPAVLLVGGLWRAGRSHPHTVYQPDRWQRWDWVIVAGALVGSGRPSAAAAGHRPRHDLFTIRTSLNWPGFDWRIGLATLGLAAPALCEQLSGRGAGNVNDDDSF